LRERKGAIIKFAPINEDGDIIIDELKKLITSKTKIIAVTHLSNVTGTIVPIKEIVEIAHKKNVPVLVDGCQAVPHIKVDVTDLDCDFYAFSGHKVYGPTGVGILYAKKKWLERLPPYVGGGAMISEVKKNKIVYALPPEKYEAGTMPTAEVIAFKESIKFMESIGIGNLIKHEDEIKNYALEKLRKINSVKIIGNPKNKAGVIAFTIQGIHPHDIATILDDDGVAIRAGHHCCQILHEKLNLTATARASIGVYNNKDDIDILCKAIENCKKIFD
jgi:cysteine desulfurase/selenocysteine lyase